VDPRGSWLPPTERCPIVQQWHSTRNVGFRDAVMKDCWTNRDGGRIRPGINLQEEPGKDGRLGRDV
jgi:hypothetical protein